MFSKINIKNKNLNKAKKGLILSALAGLTVYNIIEAKQEVIENNGSTERKIKVSGDVLQVFIPTIAMALSIYTDDEQAQTQFIKSAVSTFSITHALKHGLNKARPNGGTRSFPSGHTSSAFQGAAFIHKKQGLVFATPAYLGAGYVAFTRVNTKRHFVSDVIAGALIGTLESFRLVKDKKNG